MCAARMPDVSWPGQLVLAILPLAQSLMPGA
jgi:hypothetical protein